MNRAVFDSVRRDVYDLCASDLGPVDFISSVGLALSRAVPRDSWALHAVDPATFLPVSGSFSWLSGSRRLNVDELAEMAAEEFLAPGINAFTDLARAPQTVSAWHLAAEAPRSPSHRFMLYQRVGITDELRAAFVSNGACWGVSTLCRQGGRPFSVAEVNFVASISSRIGAALRRSVWQKVPVKAPTFSPAIVVLDEQDGIAEMSAGAHLWLEELKVFGPELEPGLPLLIAIVAKQTRRRGAALLPGAAFRRVKTLTEGWVSLRGSRLKGQRDGSQRIAVVVEPAPRDEIVDFMLTSCRISSRERQIALLLAQGYDPGEISKLARLSPFTVRDHLKNVFEKCEVHSRVELISKLFVNTHPVQTLLTTNS
jgi:DNA-binding CsgD family transcriptional regulator